MEGLSTEEKIALSDVRFKKSKEMLSDAVKTFKAGMYLTSVNRILCCISFIPGVINTKRHRPCKT